MQRMLSRWALAMQEFDFNIIYRKESLNSNADELSHQSFQEDQTPVSMTVAKQPCDKIQHAQRDDNIISKIYGALLTSNGKPQGNEWNSSPLHHYAQNVVC